jgi:hypothetical protein
MTGDPAADPAWNVRVLRGSPSDEEVAALVAVLRYRAALLTASASCAMGDEGPRPAGFRVRPAAAPFGVRAYLQAGGWRAPTRRPP